MIDHRVSVWYLDNDCALSMQIFHSCFLMGFFPLSHLNWLLLLSKLAVMFCIYVLGLFESFYLGVIFQEWVSNFHDFLFKKKKKKLIFHVLVMAQKINYKLLCYISKGPSKVFFFIIVISLKVDMKITVVPTDFNYKVAKWLKNTHYFVIFSNFLLNERKI